MCAPPPIGLLSCISPGAQVSSRHTTSDERGQESGFWARLAASNPHPRARFDLVCPRRCTLSSLPRPIFCCRFDGGRRPLGLRQVGPRVKVPTLGLPMPQCHRHHPSLRLRATHAMFRLRRRSRQWAARRPRSGQRAGIFARPYWPLPGARRAYRPWCRGPPFLPLPPLLLPVRLARRACCHSHARAAKWPFARRFAFGAGGSKIQKKPPGFGPPSGGLPAGSWVPPTRWSGGWVPPRRPLPLLALNGAAARVRQQRRARPAPTLR